MSARLIATSVAVLGLAAFAAPVRSFQQAAPAPGSTPWQQAVDAWEAGDYPQALETLQALLRSSDAAQYLDRAAQLTGEIFVTAELTPDGRNPAISADGRFATYETGPTSAPVTVVSRVTGATAEEVSRLPGGGAVFAPSGAEIAWIRPPQTPEWAAAVRALAATDTPAPARQAAQASLAWLLAKDGALVVRDLDAGTDRVVDTGTLLKADVTWGAGGRLLFLGAAPDDLSRSDVYQVAAASAPARVTTTDGFKSNVTVAGGTLVYQPGNAPTFREPEPAAEAGGGRGGRGGFGGRGGGGGRGRGGPATYIVQPIAGGAARTVTGLGLTVSADGSTLAWIDRDADTYTLNVSPAAGDEVSAVRTGRDRIDAPALSPDGQRVVYQLMTDRDWEIYLSDRAGTHTRVTRDIQHDVLPRFLTSRTLLGMMGEPRHRRAQVYDLEAGTRTRVFDNNRVRTISPEYVWVPSADGRHLAIQADRDGDTVSAERGVYVVDLTKKVTAAEVLARVESQLRDERDLRDRMTRAFEPVADQIRSVLAKGRVNRVWDYEKALFDFDSKYVTQPGNAKAIEYLEKTYRSFGYDPVLQRFEARGAPTANIVSTLRGTTDPDLIYVVSSHFDSVAVGPGADDDTSGTAALLEAARMLAGTPLPATVVFASFTGEEAGLLGSRHFVQVVHDAGWNIVGALNNDMIGWAGEGPRMDNTIRYSNAGIRDIQHGAAFLFTNLITYDAKYYRGTDAAAYYEAWGDIVGGIGSYPVLANPNYHQPTDFLETMNHQQILETAKVTAATLVYLASSPSRLKDLRADRATSGVTLQWTPSPETGVRSYVVAYGPESDPLRTRLTVTEPRATLPVLPANTTVSVKAVNARGIEGWDWARVVVR